MVFEIVSLLIILVVLLSSFFSGVHRSISFFFSFPLPVFVGFLIPKIFYLKFFELYIKKQSLWLVFGFFLSFLFIMVFVPLKKIFQKALYYLNLNEVEMPFVFVFGLINGLLTINALFLIYLYFSHNVSYFVTTDLLDVILMPSRIGK